MSDQAHHHLRCVLFCDIAGYSAFVHRDEDRTLRHLQELQEMVRPLFGAHGGSVVKSTGDGFLAEFPSAIQGVRCAIAVQQSMAAWNSVRAPSERLQVRAGLHLGDVQIRDGDVYGDGVNIAARIEGVAPPGGICVSEAVAEQVRNRLDVRIVPLGRRRLKNIDQPISLHRVVLPWEEATRPRGRLQGLRWRSIALGSLAVIVLLLGAALRGRVFDTGSTAYAEARFSIEVAPGLHLAGWGPSVAISPDGSKIVYVAGDESGRRLYLRSLDSFDSREIPGTEGAVAPFFSPDGQWTAFVSEGRLQKVPIEGGVPQTIAEANVIGASWTSGGWVLFGTDPPGPVWRVHASGGEPEAVTPAERILTDASNQIHVMPRQLPEGRGILFTIALTGSASRVAVFDARSGEQRVILEPGTDARYLPSGHLVYGWAGDLLAVPFDLDHLEVTGHPVHLVSGVRTTWHGVDYDIARDGTLVYVRGTVEYVSRRPVWVDRSGAIDSLALPPAHYQSPRISPDGRSILLTRVEETANIWLHDLERSLFRRLTDGRGDEWWSVWGNDGSEIFINSSRTSGRTLELHRTTTQGGDPERLMQFTGSQAPQAWSKTPPGVVFLRFGMAEQAAPTMEFDVWLLPFAGEDPGEPRPILNGRASEVNPVPSPDGQWIAYASDQGDRIGGRSEVYVGPYGRPGEVRQVSLDGGMGPLWSDDGRTLYFRSVDGSRMYAATVTEGRVDRPVQLFQGSFLPDWWYGRNWDLDRANDRFLMLTQAATAEKITTFRVVLGWGASLDRRIDAAAR